MLPVFSRQALKKQAHTAHTQKRKNFRGILKTQYLSFKTLKFSLSGTYKYEKEKRKKKLKNENFRQRYELIPSRDIDDQRIPESD